MSEWSKIEYELTRERGLWGPEIPSKLDKWMLDTVEGTVHVRKCTHIVTVHVTLILDIIFDVHYLFSML